MRIQIAKTREVISVELIIIKQEEKSGILNESVRDSIFSHRYQNCKFPRHKASEKNKLIQLSSQEILVALQVISTSIGCSTAQVIRS